MLQIDILLVTGGKTINELLVKVEVFVMFYINGGFFNICKSFDLKILVSSSDTGIDENEHKNKVLHIITLISQSVE